MSEVAGIKLLGVVGAGQMGSGIAQVAAQAGLSVLLSDASIAQAEKSKARLEASLNKLVEKGKLGAEDARNALSRITPVGGVGELASCDFVVEAATEAWELKSQIFKQLDASVAPNAILATNTSSLSITKIAAVTSRPERIVGVHFFNPVPVMKLVEVIRALQTSDETYRVATNFASALNKTVVTAKDSPGFLVNRVLLPLLIEACHALQEGVGTAEDIDRAVKLGLNHPMGPFELSDFIGLDTVLAIAEVLQRETGDNKYRAPVLLRNYVSAGWLGRKTGRGFYNYSGK